MKIKNIIKILKSINPETEISRINLSTEDHLELEIFLDELGFNDLDFSIQEDVSNIAPYLGKICDNCHQYTNHGCTQEKKVCSFENFEEAVEDLLYAHQKNEN